ncbi:MAG: hypothetical protein P8189_05405 [Anaerolineae bacterium]|jgi:hypothetical protein
MSDHTTHMLYARGYEQAKCGEFGSGATLYARSRRHGRWGHFWPTASRHSRCLLDLSEIGDTYRVEARSYAGLHTVPIGQIRGSEGRSNDFDCDFNPLQDHSRARWLRVAAARDQDKVLPPVVLIQVGDVYFVRDGHHRISVAQALGQLDIEAEVTVWHVSGLLPEEMLVGTAAPHVSGQGVRGAYRNGAAKSGPIVAWLQSLLPWFTRAEEPIPVHSTAAA